MFNTHMCPFSISDYRYHRGDSFPLQSCKRIASSFKKNYKQVANLFFLCFSSFFVFVVAIVIAYMGLIYRK